MSCKVEMKLLIWIIVEQPFIPEDPDTIVDMSVFTDFADLDGYELVHLFHEEEEDDFLNLSYSEDLNQLPLLLIDEDALGKKKWDMKM